MPHMMTDHASSQALRSHLSTTASPISDLLRYPFALKGVDADHINMLLMSARDSHDHTVVTVDE